MNTVLSENIVKANTAKRIFSLELSRETALSFIFMAAAKGLTPEALMENFVKDIVSANLSDEISEEENNLREWYKGSWFSQDDDSEYFSFLQYAVCNGVYAEIIEAYFGVSLCNLKTGNGVNAAHYSELREKHLSFIKRLFDKYCLKNKAHLSFDEEFKKIVEFDRHTDEILSGDP